MTFTVQNSECKKCCFDAFSCLFTDRLASVRSYDDMSVVSGPILIYLEVVLDFFHDFSATFPRTAPVIATDSGDREFYQQRELEIQNESRGL